MFHDRMIIWAASPALKMTIFCATVMLIPPPTLTSIVTVTFTGKLPVLLTETVISTDLPAVTERVERLAATSWIDGRDEVTTSMTVA